MIFYSIICIIIHSPNSFIYSESKCLCFWIILLLKFIYFFVNISIKYLSFIIYLIIIDNFIEVDCKDLTTRYANDVIASCAFGIKVDSHTDENNEFYKMGKAASTFSFKQILLMTIAYAFPKLAKVSFFQLWFFYEKGQGKRALGSPDGK